MFGVFRTVAVALIALGASSVVLSQSQYGPDTRSGNYWLPKCRSPLYSEPFGNCLSFVNGFDAAMSLADARPGATRFYCLPLNVTIGQGINVVVAYADRNPQLTHLDFGVLIASAFREAFPCR